MNLRFADGRSASADPSGVALAEVEATADRSEMADGRARALDLALDPDLPVFMADMRIQSWRSALSMNLSLRSRRGEEAEPCCRE
jgi:hypothetical protein